MFTHCGKEQKNNLPRGHLKNQVSRAELNNEKS